MSSTSSDRRMGVNTSRAIKVSVRVATTANITLSGEQTIDGVAVVADDRVLVKNQTTASQNGIYTAATLSWTRAIDFNDGYDVGAGTLMFVNPGGTVSGGKEYYLATTGTITIGTTSLTFTLKSAGAGTGDMVASNNLSDVASVATARTNLGLRSAAISEASAFEVAGAAAAITPTSLGLVIGTDVQAYADELAAIAGLVSAADRVPYFTGAGTASLATLTAAGRALIDDADVAAQLTTLGVSAFVQMIFNDADAAAVRATIGVGAGTGDLVAANNLSDVAAAATARTNLGLEIGVNVQAYDAELAAIAGLVSAADRVPYFTGLGAASLATFTAAGRALVDDADAPAQLTTLGVSAFIQTLLDDATAAAARTTLGVASGSGDMVSTNNLSDVASKATSLSNLGVAAGYTAPIANPPLGAAAQYPGVYVFTDTADTDHGAPPNTTAMCEVLIYREATGNQQAGPECADIGLGVVALKKSWTSSATTGEIGAMQLAAYQGSVSDVSAVLLLAQKRSGGTGAVTTAEWRATLADGTGAVTTEMHGQIGWVSGTGTTNVDGYVAEMWLGTGQHAFLVQSDDSTYLGSTPIWVNAFTVRPSRLGTVAYNVTALGIVTAALGNAAAPSYSFVLDPNTGICSGGADILAFVTNGAAKWAIDQTGNLTPAVTNAYTIGGSSYLINAAYITHIYTGGGSAAAPTHTFVSETDTGMYLYAANALGFTTSGVARWVIDSAGNLAPITDNAYTLGGGSFRINAAYAVTFYGALSGNATTATSATSASSATTAGSCTGNAATATTVSGHGTDLLYDAGAIGSGGTIIGYRSIARADGGGAVTIAVYN